MLLEVLYTRFSRRSKRMLSVLASYSMIVIVPISIRGISPAARRGFFFRRLPRLRPTILVFAVVIALLAIDFAVASALAGPFKVRFYVSDSAALLIPVLAWFFIKPTVLELWISAAIVGTIGVIAIPSITIR
jgi:hypothetical protein